MKIVELEEIINNAFEDLQNISEKSDANILNAIRAVSYTHLTLPTNREV